MWESKLLYLEYLGSLISDYGGFEVVFVMFEIMRILFFRESSLENL